MKNYLLVSCIIIICIGVFYYLNQKNKTDIIFEDQKIEEDYAEVDYGIEDYNEENALGVVSYRNYDEARIQLSPSQLYSSYESNSIRAEMDFDSKLIELTGSPYKVDIAPDGDGVIYFLISRSNSTFIYAKGGQSFKEDAANVTPGDTGGGIFLKQITLLCYLDGFSIENPILTDCIFDHKTNSKREADRVTELKNLKEKSEDISDNTPYVDAADNIFYPDTEMGTSVDTVAEEKNTEIRKTRNEKKVKIEEPVVKRESIYQESIETDTYDTTYVDGYEESY